MAEAIWGRTLKERMELTAERLGVSPGHLRAIRQGSCDGAEPVVAAMREAGLLDYNERRDLAAERLSDRRTLQLLALRHGCALVHLLQIQDGKARGSAELRADLMRAGLLREQKPPLPAVPDVPSVPAFMVRAIGREELLTALAEPQVVSRDDLAERFGVASSVLDLALNQHGGLLALRRDARRAKEGSSVKPRIQGLTRDALVGLMRQNPALTVKDLAAMFVCGESTLANKLTTWGGLREIRKEIEAERQRVPGEPPEGATEMRWVVEADGAGTPPTPPPTESAAAAPAPEPSRDTATAGTAQTISLPYALTPVPGANQPNTAELPASTISQEYAHRRALEEIARAGWSTTHDPDIRRLEDEPAPSDRTAEPGYYYAPGILRDTDNLIAAGARVIMLPPDGPPCAVPEPAPAPLAGSTEALIAGSICRTCVKADVCRYNADVTAWVEDLDGPDLGVRAPDIEFDVTIRRCGAYLAAG